jgi:hypothetical protein
MSQNLRGGAVPIGGQVPVREVAASPVPGSAA